MLQSKKEEENQKQANALKDKQQNLSENSNINEVNSENKIQKQG